ncbi:hypothetical protein EI969_11610 [Pseudomonas sp. PB101]|nr:hypothetical protein [Pseudomonas sp. PB101]
MLAMHVNDDAGILYARVALVFIASRLAPTGMEAGQVRLMRHPAAYGCRSGDSPLQCTPRP